MADESLRIVPANEVTFEDLQRVFGQRGPAARCQCQRYRLARGESFGGQPVEERRHRLREQAGCGDPDAATCGLVAWLGDEPVGWCAVGQRSDLAGLTRVFTVPWKDRDEDRADPTVWAVTCLCIRKGFRRRGLASALVRATVAFARDRGARAVEGYPIARTDVLNEELHVGTVPMFEQAGYRQVSRPTPRRLVMRRDVGTARHWVIVASRDHARRGVDAGFIMANHGKRAPLARMSRGDGILIYSPTTIYPNGGPLRAVTFVGEVTGDEPEPSDVIAGGFRRAATLREIEPLPLAQIREHLPASRLRFGCFELDAADADAILALVPD